MKRVKENIGSFDDPINRSNDPLNDPLSDPLNGTLNGQTDTIKGQSDTINDTIKRNNDPLTISSGTLNGTLNGTLKNNHQVLSLIKKQPGIRTNFISNQTAISIRTLRRILKELIDSNEIEYRGSKKTGGYYIKTNPK